MRNTSSLPSIDDEALAAVTGGCHKKCSAPPPPQGPPPSAGGGTSVEVATGAQGGQLIQQALGGGQSPLM